MIIIWSLILYIIFFSIVVPAIVRHLRDKNNPDIN